MMLGCVHILKKVPTSSVCRAPASSPVTGFHGTSSSYKATWLKRTSRAHHHTWITGHPHRIAFNNTSASLSSANSVGNASSSQQACSLGTTAGAGAGASAHVPSGTLMDFAGNSRFLANHLARFSTLSAVSSASSPSPSSPAAFSPVSSQQQPQGSSKTRASPSQDADPSSGSGSSSAQTKFGTSATTASPSTDDKEDDAWEVNESFTGHSGSSRSITTSDSRINPQKPDETELPARATSGSSASTDQDDTQDTLRHNHHHSDDDSPTTLRPSLSSFKDAASIEKSWRRTSDQLSQSASSSPSSSSSTGSTAGTTLSRSGGQNQAGNLDLSSSTLVQQMLFGDRRPSSSETEEANKTKGDQTSADATNVEDVLQSEVKTESPSLKELLDLATTNSKEDTKPATTPLTPPHATSPASSDPVASSKSKKKEASPNTNKKSGGSQEGEGADEDHIAKLDIRVGIVRSVERHPDAESLYIEQVDVGDSLDSVQPASEANGVSSSSTRTIVSGLVKHIPKDYLEGRAVIVVRNMKPSKLRGVTSHGMLLCGMEKDSDGLVTKVELLEPAEGSQPGDKVLFEGFTDENTLPVPVLTPKRKWFEKTQVHFSVQDGIAFYKGSPFKTVRGLVRCRSINKGEIS